MTLGKETLSLVTREETKIFKQYNRIKPGTGPGTQTECSKHFCRVNQGLCLGPERAASRFPNIHCSQLFLQKAAREGELWVGSQG